MEKSEAKPATSTRNHFANGTTAEQAARTMLNVRKGDSRIVRFSDDIKAYTLLHKELPQLRLT